MAQRFESVFKCGLGDGIAVANTAKCLIDAHQTLIGMKGHLVIF